MSRKNQNPLTLIDANLEYNKMPIYHTIKEMGLADWLEELIRSDTFSIHFKEMKNEIENFKDLIKKSDKKETKINVTNKKKTKTRIIDNNILKNRKVLLKANAYHLKNLVILKMMEFIVNNKMIFNIYLNEGMQQYLNERIMSKSFGFVTMEVKSEILKASLKGNDKWISKT